MKFILSVFLFFFLSISFSADTEISSDTTITSDTTGRYTFDSDGLSLTISNNSTLGKPSQTIRSQDSGGNTVNDITVTIEQGSTVETTGNDRPIYINGASGFTLHNYGNIEAERSVSISMGSGTTGAIINNYSSGKIFAPQNGIINSASVANDNTINNYGEIYSTTTSSGYNVIAFMDGASGNNIINNNGGNIYVSGEDGVAIKLGSSSTLTNIGTVSNTYNPGSTAIKLAGDNNTIELKDGGKVIGLIVSDSGTSGNKLKLNHGLGKTYYYETSGDFDLEDLSGNQVLKGSASSVGQGGSETVDEILNYKNLNIRRAINKYILTKNYFKNTNWGETYYSSIERKPNSTKEAIDYNIRSYGVNLFYPIKDAYHIILNMDSSQQELDNDHDIERLSYLAGIYAPNFTKILNTTLNGYIISGISYNKSSRIILTNTTSSGILEVEDFYRNFDVILGTSFLPYHSSFIKTEAGISLAISHIPNHNETHYFSWKEKNIIQPSIYFNESYSMLLRNKIYLSAGWELDYRKVVLGKKQEYSINSAKGTHSPDQEVNNEVTIGGNLNITADLYKNTSFYFDLSSRVSNQIHRSYAVAIGIKVKN